MSSAVALAPKLSTDEGREILATARDLDEEFHRPLCAGRPVPLMGEDDRRAALSEALAAAFDIWMDSAQAHVVEELAPHLTKEECRQALAAVRGPPRRGPLVGAKALTCPGGGRLDTEDSHAALSEAPAATLGSLCSTTPMTLAAPSSELGALDRGSLHPLWSETLHRFASDTRADLCDDLSTFSDVILALGSPDAAGRMARAILDVGRWWP